MQIIINKIYSLLKTYIWLISIYCLSIGIVSINANELLLSSSFTYIKKNNLFNIYEQDKFINIAPLNELKELGKNLIQKNKLNEAQYLYQKILDRFPLDYEIILFNTLFSFIHGSTMYTLMFLKRILKIYPNDPMALSLLANLYYSNQEYSLAYTTAKKTLNQQEDNPLALWVLYILNIKDENYTQATQIIHKINASTHTITP